jgi:hypothetical protein
MHAQAPPEFLRAVVDGAFEPVLVVLSNGNVWHKNEPTYRVFPVLDETGSGCVIPARVSDYISFSTSYAASMSWEDFIAGGPFLNNACTVAGHRTSASPCAGSGANFPLKINVVRTKCSELNLASYEQDDFYYVLYIQKAGNDFVLELQNQININDGILDACKKITMMRLKLI